MPTAITHVEPHSIAEKIGLVPGDLIEKISGEEIIDQIDYQALTAHRQFPIEVVHADGSRETLKVRKKDWEPLGLTLDQNIVSNPRPCKNHCIFCFIDQMPPGMRKTLYVKDDDWRLSLMMGNFITMTNISDEEFDRILRRRVSPLYISVQCTDADMRCALLRNPHAGKLMERLHILKEHGIRFHCQIVLCPGWNDGAILERSLKDLAALYPAAQSVALVPVGLTKYRENLAHIDPYNKETATALVRYAREQQAVFMEQMGTRFVFPSDEFFCLSGLPLPEDEEYEGYPQIENGVGMLRLFETDISYAAEDYPCDSPSPLRRVIACGTSAAGFIRRMIATYAPPGTQLDVIPIRNRFFGESVTVTGLITGGDLIDQLKHTDYDEILICRNMIRNEGDLFLDDISVDQVRDALPSPLRIVSNTGEGFWKAICGMEE